MSQKAGHWSWISHFYSLISFFCCSTERVTIWRLMTLSLTTVPEWGERELIVWRFLLLYQMIRTPCVYWCSDSPPCYDFHAKPDMLFLGQTLSSDAGASQEYSSKLLKLCRSHFRKERGLLFGKLKLSKPSLFFFLLIFKSRAPWRHFVS